PEVVGADATGCAVSDVRDTADVLGAAGELSRDLQDLPGADALELLLGLAELGDQSGDAFGQLLAADLQLLGELGHEDVLLGQEAERVDAHERLDTAHAGADGLLAQHLDQAELAGPGDVGATAQL